MYQFSNVCAGANLTDRSVSSDQTKLDYNSRIVIGLPPPKQITLKRKMYVAHAIVGTFYHFPIRIRTV